ncbi:MAG: hypothetical protein MUC56_10355 [Thermoanaerobaculales bacterium]|jgi:hypothetical protein|nr:hypothetical protein [Thermoanaerobaculales bacterium]
MAGQAVRALAAAAALIGATGCAVTTVDQVDFVYYFYGPEAALGALSPGRADLGDPALVELERSIALLELGLYSDSASAIGRAARILETRPPVAAALGDPPPWQPELHERVLVHSVELADHLALYEPAAAAETADRTLAAVAAAECDGCDLDFAQVLAALAYEVAGRHRDGLAALAGVAAPEIEPEGDDPIIELRQRLERGVIAAEPEGLAPPPVVTERSLAVILLLGRGPYKAPDKLELGPGRSVRWASYLPRDPQPVVGAVLELDDPVVSLELVDVERLAAASLAERAGRVVATGGAGIDPKRRDLRHWSSLPDTIHLLAADIPTELESVDLVFLSPDGLEADRETLELPPEWTGGRLFVVRRVP